MSCFLSFVCINYSMLDYNVGGDTFSGCGTEPSHTLERDDLSYEQGYELFILCLFNICA